MMITHITKKNDYLPLVVMIIAPLLAASPKRDDASDPFKTWIDAM